MWNQDVVNKIIEIHDGKSGTERQQWFMRECMEFYGMKDDIGNPGYCFGYEALIDMMNGKRSNSFLWIEYMDTHELVYCKE